jgi:hypothetical protein
MALPEVQAADRRSGVPRGGSAAARARTLAAAGGTPAGWRGGPVPAGVASSTLLALQASGGNRAVTGLLAPVQRCGGEMHEGCPCAEEEGRPAPRPAAPVQRFTDGTAEAPSPDLPDGSQYAGMEPALLAMLRRTLAAKCFWVFVNARPTNLGAALDGLNPADINTLVQLYRKLSSFGLWGNIDVITGLWSTSSLGVDFRGPGDMAATAEGTGHFCRDTAIGESYHPGKSCWREIVATAGTPGLHICMPGSVHIDPHQTSDGTSTAWTLDGWTPRLTTACSYAFMGFLSHMADVEGGRPVNVFTRFEADRKRARQTLPTLEGLDTADRPRYRAQVEDDQRRLTALEPTLRTWSAQGLEQGTPADATRVLNELTAVETDLDQVDAAVTNAQVPPMYGL